MNESTGILFAIRMSDKHNKICKYDWPGVCDKCKSAIIYKDLGGDSQLDFETPSGSASLSPKYRTGWKTNKSRIEEYLPCCGKTIVKLFEANKSAIMQAGFEDPKPNAAPVAPPAPNPFAFKDQGDSKTATLPSTSSSSKS